MRELEQFLGRGNERVWWILSMKNIGGGVIGAMTLNQVGQLLGGGGTMIALSVIGLLLGLWMTWNRRGLIRLRRWLVAARFLLARAIHAPQATLDMATIFTTPDAPVSMPLHLVPRAVPEES